MCIIRIICILLKKIFVSKSNLNQSTFFWQDTQIKTLNAEWFVSGRLGVLNAGDMWIDCRQKLTHDNILMFGEQGKQ